MWLFSSVSSPDKTSTLFLVLQTQVERMAELFTLASPLKFIKCFHMHYLIWLSCLEVGQVIICFLDKSFAAMRAPLPGFLTPSPWAFPFYPPALGKTNTWNHFWALGRKCSRAGGQDLVTALAFGINELQGINRTSHFLSCRTIWTGRRGFEYWPCYSSETWNSSFNLSEV